MKLNVRDFLSKLKLNSLSVGKNAYNPILAKCVLSIENGYLNIITSDLFSYMITKVPVETDATFRTLVDFSVLKDTVSSFTGEIELEYKDNTLVISKDKSSIKLLTYDYEDFIDMPELETHVFIPIDNQIVKNVIDKLSVFASDVSGREHLQGIYLVPKGNELVAYATNGFVLGHITTSIEAFPDTPLLFVNTATIKSVVAMLDVPTASLCIDNKYFVIHNDIGRLYVRKYDYAPLPVEQLLKTGSTYKVVTEVSQLMETLKRMQSFMKNSTTGNVQLSYNESLTLHCENNLGEITDSLVTEEDYPYSIDFYFTLKYMINSLSLFDREVYMYFDSENAKSVLLENGEYRVKLMGVKVI